MRLRYLVLAVVLLLTACSGASVVATASPSPRPTLPPPRSCSEAAQIVAALDPYIYQRIDYHTQNGADWDTLLDDGQLLSEITAAHAYQASHECP